MDLIEFLFGVKKEEPKPKIKKKELKINEQIDEPKTLTPIQARQERAKQKRSKNAVQIKKTNDILENKSTEDLQEVEEKIRNKN
tara:strand:+ start:47 stop:298 length:252 start_codon:yes stop_codon:yes gene_type:complete